MEKVKLLPVSYIWGVGRVTDQELKSMGIETIGDLAGTPLVIIENKFGDLGRTIHEMANGIDNRKVESNQEPKSIGREVTYRKDVDDFGILRSTLLLLSQKISRNLRLKKYKGKAVTLKVRFSDFKTVTRRATLKNYTYGIFDIHRSSLLLLKNFDLKRKKIRLIGVSVSSLRSTFMLENLLSSDKSVDENLAEAIDRISDKFGENKLTIARLVNKDEIMD
jgi:DNA polymerase-4